MSKPIPVYRTGHLPNGLATVTMLRRDRRKPSPGQKPVAVLVYRGGKERTYLYQVADSSPMRPLSPAQRAAARARRIWPYACGQCGKDNHQPLADQRDGVPLCTACLTEHDFDQMRAARPRARAEAATWAAEVLADPDALFVAVATIEVKPQTRSWKRTAVRTLVVADTAGDLTAFELIPREQPRRKRDLPADAVPLAQIDAQLVDLLSGRRLVPWSEGEVSILDWELHASTSGDIRPRLYASTFRTMRHHYSRWVGQIRYGLGGGFVTQQRPPGGPADVVTWMQHTARRMAARPEHEQAGR